MNKQYLKWLLIILIIILVNAAIWYFGLSPTLAKIDNVEKEIEVTKAKKAKLEQRLVELDAIDVETLEQEANSLNLRVPELCLLPEFLTNLEATAEDLGVVLGSIRASEPHELEPYFAMNLTLDILGDYPSVFKYIQYLEQQERLLLIQSFFIRGEKEKLSSSIQCTIFAEDFDQYTPLDAPGRDNPFLGQ